MGYKTRCRIEAYSVDKDGTLLDESETIYEFFREDFPMAAEAAFEAINGRWGDIKRWLFEVSQEYPSIIIEATGIGESFPDFWKYIYLNGKEVYTWEQKEWRFPLTLFWKKLRNFRIQIG